MESQQVIMNSNSCPFLWTYKSIIQVLCVFDGSMFDAANFMGRDEDDFKSDRKSRIFHLLFDLTKIISYPVRNYDCANE